MIFTILLTLVPALVAQPGNVAVDVDNKAHFAKAKDVPLVRKAEAEPEKEEPKKQEKLSPLEQLAGVPKDADRVGPKGTKSFPMSLLEEEDDDLALDELEAMTISYALLAKLPAVNCQWSPWDPDPDSVKCDVTCGGKLSGATGKTSRFIKRAMAHRGQKCKAYSGDDNSKWDHSQATGARETRKVPCGQKPCPTTTTTTTTTTMTTMKAASASLTPFWGLVLLVWLNSK